jgi:hypothetical protein
MKTNSIFWTRTGCLAMLALIGLPLSAQSRPAGHRQACSALNNASVTASGTFTASANDTVRQYLVSVDVKCDASGQPQGALKLSGLALNGAHDGVMTATSFARLTSHAGATPTAYLSGNCSLASAQTGATTACRYWVRLSQVHQGTDVGIVAFSISHGKNAPVESGAGRIADSGSVKVSSIDGVN